jgi:hypothetical protein
MGYQYPRPTAGWQSLLLISRAASIGILAMTVLWIWVVDNLRILGPWRSYSILSYGCRAAHSININLSRLSPVYWPVNLSLALSISPFSSAC